MQLTVTYTRQDLHEATVPVRDKRHSRVAVLVVGIGVILVLALLALLAILLSASDRGTLPPALKRSSPPQDFLLTLVPSLVPGLILPLLLAIVLVRGQGPKRASKRRRTILMLLICGCIALGSVPVWMLIDAETIIEWRPSRTDIVFTAVVSWIFSAFLCVTILLTWHRGQLKTRWRNSPSLHRPRQIELAPETGVRICDDVLDYRLSWQFFESARETANLIILGGEDARIYMIPKRCFPSPEALIEAKSMIRSNIARCQLLTDFSAFPVLPKPPLQPAAQSPPPAPARES
jgi:hypothetical protein